MKNNTIKMYVAILVVLISIAIVSGCNNNASVVMEEETIELLWYGFGRKQPEHDVVMEEVNKILKTKLNTTLKLDMIDTGSYENKMNLTIAANEVFDLCFTSNWLNKYVPNVTKGAYLPLKDLIEKETPGLLRAIPETLFEVAYYKDDIYAIPNYQIIYDSAGIFVQKRLADKYNLDLEKVNSLTELEPFLKQIRDNESGIYPFKFDMEVLLREYEGISPAPISILKTDSKLKVVGQAYLEETRNAQAFYASFFNKGYMRRDLLTVLDDSSDVNNNKYAVITGTVKPGGESSLKNRTGEEYISKALQTPYISARSGLETMTAVSKTSKNPVDAIKLLELVNTDAELYNLIVFGIEGRHYNKISDNVVQIHEDTKYTMGSQAWQFGNQFNAYYMEGQEIGIWEETDRINREAEVSPIRGFNLDIEPIKNEIAQLEAVEKEYNLKRLFARQDWEKAYDEYVEKSKRAGLDKVIEEAQRQIDEFKGNK